MTDRPTPEQLAIDYAHRSGMDTDDEARDFIALLAEHGYVIVHPDDVPAPDDRVTYEYFRGWRACSPSREPGGGDVTGDLYDHPSRFLWLMLGGLVCWAILIGLAVTW